MRLGPVGMRRVLDGFAVGLAIATVARLADHEILLQSLWVILGIGAYLYGLRGAVLRILITAVGAAALAVVGPSIGVPLDPEMLEPEDMGFSEFAEWPLMIGIALIVAFLADRIGSSARRYATLYRQASERLLTAHEDERHRLARDLHDGVGQTLTAVMLTLDAAEAQLWAGPNPPSALARSTIQRAQTLAASALEESRDVAAQLRPTRIREIGLGAALRNLADDAGVAVDVRFDPGVLPPGVIEAEREIDAYRIVQEAVANAARHSRASSIWIDGRVRDGEIGLEVGDDGVGIDPSGWTRGLGLAGMQERASVLQARLDVRSRPGAGTIIELSIPRSRHVDDDGRPGAVMPFAGTVG